MKLRLINGRSIGTRQPEHGSAVFVIRQLVTESVEPDLSYFFNHWQMRLYNRHRKSADNKLIGIIIFHLIYVNNEKLNISVDSDFCF